MIAILLCLATCWPFSEANDASYIDLEKYHFVGDMVLPINEGEKGLNLAGKYWINNSIPTVLYTIDPSRIEIEDVVRKSLDNLELKTCFKYVRVPHNDTRHKLYYFNGGGGKCWSFVGNISHINQHISIGGGCDGVSIVTHETMHSMGFPHTQSRTDRDDNIIVNFQNMEDSSQYWMSGGSVTHGTVYNFMSTMHYLSYFFGNGLGPTFVTRDPSHERLIAASPHMTQGEAFQINTYYNCFDLMGLNCSNRVCYNGGFIINDCTCFCPGNYTGSQCETFAGAWFKPDELDRKLDEPGIMITKSYPFDNPKVTALTWARLPKCFFPKVKVLTNDMLEAYWDEHSYRMDTKNYKTVNFIGKEVNTVIDGTGNELVFRQVNRHVKPGRGIQAAVDFIPDGKCNDSYTDFTRIVCMKQKLPNGGWSYETPNYPNPTNRGIACRLTIPLSVSDLSTYSFTLDYKLQTDERLEIVYGSEEKILAGPSNATLGFVAVQGMDIKYKANRNNTGYFKLKAEIQRVPKICNAVTNITSALTIDQLFTERYPQCAYPNGAMCFMLFRAEEGKKIKVTFDSVKFLENEYFLVYAKLGLIDATMVTEQIDPIVSDTNEMLLNYVFLASGVFSPFQVTISAE